jgi:sugar phosphate isomerase/epimerase
MTTPTLAAQLFTIRDFTKTTEDFATSMAKISKIGYTAVQVSAIGDISNEDVLRITDDNGLTICNTHISYDRLLNDMDAVIAQHHLWKTKHVAIGSMPADYRKTADDYKRFAVIANEIGEKLAAADLTFSYHNHSFELVKYDGQTGLDIFYSEANPEYVQAEIDTYWIQHGGGDPTVWIDRMKNRMPVVHLKDLVMVPDENGWVKHQMAEVGEGNMNWDGILQACQRAEVEWYAVEQDICQRDPFESLAISYKNLKEMGI